MEPAWFDSHCHLFDCDGSGVEVIERARAAGVRELLVAGTDLVSSERALGLAEHEGVYAAAGIHPNECATWRPSDMGPIEELLSDARVVAVGESGLDFYRDSAPEGRQREAFEAHIELSKEHDKALIIHTRASVDAAIDLLAAAGAPARVVFHCWSGDRRRLERALDLGAFISFAGNVTFAKNDALRALAGVVPEDRLLIETDSPYLTPVPHRGTPNQPSNVRLVGETVARARATTDAAIARLTGANARRLFALDP
ncbi:TatD family hydrolase [soil metagenome]